MSKFIKWLIDKGYVRSEDPHDIMEDLSGPEADYLYDRFIEEGNNNDGE